ncbi:hypothetical protein JCM6882_002072 [Rhodosporidiobolus microsporus]
MFALHHPQQPSFTDLFSSSPSSHRHFSSSGCSPYSSSSMYDLERLAYAAARQQAAEEEDRRSFHQRRQAELAAYLEAQRQRQREAAFERAVQEEVDRRQRLEQAAALREAFIRRAKLAQAEDTRRRHLALTAARRRQAALAAAVQEEQRHRAIVARAAAEEEQRRRVGEARRRQVASDQAANTFLQFLFALDDSAVADQREEPQPTNEGAAPTPAPPAVAQQAPTAAPAPSSSAPPVDFAELDDAATTLQRHFRRHATRRTALSTLERLTADFESQQSSFSPPSSLTFRSLSTSSTSTSTSTPPLAYGGTNAPFLAYEHFLTTLLSKIDEVQSGGDRVIKAERKELVKRIEAELARLDGLKEKAWESQKGASVEAEKEQEEKEVVQPVAEEFTDPSSSLPEAATAPTLSDSAVDASPASPTLAEPTPLTASSLASLPSATPTTDDHEHPTTPPSRPHSRASTRSVSSAASEELNRYIAEMRERARVLGEEVERKELEEKEQPVVAAEVEDETHGQAPRWDEQDEEGVEEIDVAATLRRMKEQAEVVDEAKETVEQDSSATEESEQEVLAPVAAPLLAKEDEEKSEAGTEDFEVV